MLLGKHVVAVKSEPYVVMERRQAVSMLDSQREFQVVTSVLQ